MSGKCFVDTNILVYAHDRSAGVKHERARAVVEELWDSGNGVLSTQVLQELCINLQKKAARPLATDEMRALVRDYSAWEVVTNTAESIVGALIVHAAESAGAAVLYSEDLSDGQVYGVVRVVNPLAG